MRIGDRCPLFVLTSLEHLTFHPTRKGRASGFRFNGEWRFVQEVAWIGGIHVETPFLQDVRFDSFLGLRLGVKIHRPGQAGTAIYGFVL